MDPDVPQRAALGGLAIRAAVAFAICAAIGVAASGCTRAPEIQLAACPSDAAVAAYVADLAAARVSKGFGSSLRLADAECARAKLVLELPRVLGPRIGYKAAFTNPSAQKRMSLAGPSWAVMFSGLMLQTGATLPARFGVRPHYEPDLVVVVKDSGLAHATSPIEALRHIEAVQPFIELPDLMLEGEPEGTAFIATNIGFRGGVLGPRVGVEPTDSFVRALAGMTVITEGADGTELARSNGDLLMGNPVNAAMWLAKTLRAAGIALQPGDLLSLGAFRPPSPAQPGTHITVRYIGLPGDPSVSVSFE